VAFEAFDEWRGESRRATILSALGIATTLGVWLLESPWWAVACFTAITLDHVALQNAIELGFKLRALLDYFVTKIGDELLKACLYMRLGTSI
jgi:glycerol-3-phosphate acyltransferase PlsY